MTNQLKSQKLAIIGCIIGFIYIVCGCSSFGKKGESERTIKKYAVALPPGWKVAVPTGSLLLPLSEADTYDQFAFDSNAVASVGIFALKPVVFLAYKETWSDYNNGSGNFLFTDPSANEINSTVANQSALSGSHTFTVGSIASVVTSNNVAMAGAMGTAIGNVAGQIIKSSTPVGAASGAVNSVTK